MQPPFAPPKLGVSMAVGTTIYIPGSAGVSRRLNTILSGRTPPPDAVGTIGDFWLNTDSYVLTGPKQGDTWPKGGVSLIGQGTGGGTGGGNQIFWGEGPPPESLSPSVNDAYIDITNMALYRAS